MALKFGISQDWSLGCTKPRRGDGHDGSDLQYANDTPACIVVELLEVDTQSRTKLLNRFLISEPEIFQVYSDVQMLHHDRSTQASSLKVGARRIVH